MNLLEWRREDLDVDPRRVQEYPGFARIQWPQLAALINMNWSLVYYVAPVSTNVNTGGGDAPIAVMGTHDVNLGAHGYSASSDSFTSLSVSGTRRCMNRHRTTVRRFGNDRIATHARHCVCLALALSSCHRLSVVGASLRESQRLGAVRTSLRDSR